MLFRSFCRTKRTCQEISDDMKERGFKTTAIHGDLGQAARERALEDFKSLKRDILVATDVAARGIDIDGITHVINYQCPDDEKTYVHRIGRTGRAGASGVAVTFVDWDELPKWSHINQSLNLDFAEPAETYSSSEHLYSELGIPTEASGRINGAKSIEKPAPKKSDRPQKSKSTTKRERVRTKRVRESH